MNPFDLSGPDFLRFFAWLCGFALLAVVLWRRLGERAPLPKLSSLDACSVAYLRGGAPEAMRVVTLVMLDRGLLHADGKSLRSVRDGWQRVRRPFERAVLQHFEKGADASSVFESSAVKTSVERLELDLAQAGLLPSDAQRTLRRVIEHGAFLVVLGVAVIKIVVAFSRGRTNVGFLFALAAITAIVLWWLTRGRRTVVGDRVLADLRALCAGLKARSAELQIGRGSYDTAMLLGVFGLDALSGASEAQVRQLFPGAYRQDGSFAGDGVSSTSSCGSSSCGSSSSSSCGSSSCGSSSSCGGGGGCGGCGGGS